LTHGRTLGISIYSKLNLTLAESDEYEYIYTTDRIKLDQNDNYEEIVFTGPIAGLQFGYNDYMIESLTFWSCKDDPYTVFERDNQQVEINSSSDRIIEKEAEVEKEAQQIGGVVWWMFLIYLGIGFGVCILCCCGCICVCSGEHKRLCKAKVEEDEAAESD